MSRRKFWTRNRPGDILKDIVGTGSAVNALPAIATDEAFSILPQSVLATKSVGDRLTDEVGGSLARALADAAGRLPIFDASDEHQENDNGIVEEEERLQNVEIPGLNEGSFEIIDADDDEDGVGDEEGKSEEEKKRMAAAVAYRQMQGAGGAISKEFMAHWSSSRATNIVLSTVAAENKSDAAAEDKLGGSENEATDDDGKAGVADARSISTPLFTSDMSMNPNAAAQAAKVQQMAEEGRFESSWRV